MAIKKIVKKAEPVIEEPVEEVAVVEAKSKKSKAEKEAFDAEFPYGINDLCEALGDEVDPRNVRRFLRQNEIEKAGKRYGWATESDLNEVIEAFSVRAVRAGRPKKDKTNGTEEVQAVEASEDESEYVEAPVKKTTKIKRKVAATA